VLDGIAVTLRPRLIRLTWLPVAGAEAPGPRPVPQVPLAPLAPLAPLVAPVAVPGREPRRWHGGGDDDGACAA